MSQTSARSQRSAGGMAGAMVVLVVLILVWVGVRSLGSDDPSSPVKPVDYARDAAAARKAAGFNLLAPAGLPDGWRATTVRFRDGPAPHWHLGVLTDTERYVGLEQGKVSVRSMVTSYVDPEPARGEPVDVAGRPWATYTDSGGDLGLVRRDGRTTTLVVGHDVPRATLVSYAESLR